MTPAMIPYYLESRMNEMGYCNGFAMRLKHYVIAANQRLRIAAFSELYILLEQASDIKIESDTGVFDISGTNNQQQHEHTGQITLTNLSADGTCHIQFIQAIPLENNHEACAPCKQSSR